MIKAHIWTLDSALVSLSPEPPKSPTWRSLFRFHIRSGASVENASAWADSGERSFLTLV